jgi:hypothetical protein
MADTDGEVLEAPDRGTELQDAALDWVNSTFARTVALKLTPILLPILGAAAFWLEDTIGIGMDPAVAAAFVVSVVIGLAGVVTAYVFNHGRGAAVIGQSALELEKLYEAGRAAVANDQVGQPEPAQLSGPLLDDDYDLKPLSESPQETGARPDLPPELPDEAPAR